MSILVDENSRIVVQGITGKEGTFHTEQMINYGTIVAAGVTPGKGGQKVGDVPVFNTVEEAVNKENANTSCIFVPPPFAADTILEAASAGIGVIVCITEGIPVMDMVKVASYLRGKETVLIRTDRNRQNNIGGARLGRENQRRAFRKKDRGALCRGESQSPIQRSG